MFNLKSCIVGLLVGASSAGCAERSENEESSDLNFSLRSSAVSRDFNNGTIYVVKRGDSLSAIVKNYDGLSVSKIAELNNIKNINKIYPGQELIIPAEYFDSETEAFRKQGLVAANLQNDWPDLAVSMIKEFEGLKLETYRCSAGVCTIGWGHTEGVTPDTVIRLDQAERYLEQDLKKAENLMDQYIKVPLSPHQKAALLSLTFNLGEQLYKNKEGRPTNTLLTINSLNAKNEQSFLEWQDSVSKAMLRWHFVGTEPVPGLHARRCREVEVFRMDSYRNYKEIFLSRL
jgi:GH24 family phage-related lysozyme (muramidase)